MAMYLLGSSGDCGDCGSDDPCSSATVIEPDPLYEFVDSFRLRAVSESIQIVIVIMRIKSFDGGGYPNDLWDYRFRAVSSAGDSISVGAAYDFQTASDLTIFRGARLRETGQSFLITYYDLTGGVQHYVQTFGVNTSTLTISAISSFQNPAGFPFVLAIAFISDDKILIGYHTEGVGNEVGFRYYTLIVSSGQTVITPSGVTSELKSTFNDDFPALDFERVGTDQLMAFRTWEDSGGTWNVQARQIDTSSGISLGTEYAVTTDASQLEASYQHDENDDFAIMTVTYNSGFVTAFHVDYTNIGTEFTTISTTQVAINSSSLATIAPNTSTIATLGISGSTLTSGTPVSVTSGGESLEAVSSSVTLRVYVDPTSGSLSGDLLT